MNEIRQLSAPVTIGDLCRTDSGKDDNNLFDLKPKNMTRVDPKKLEKAEAKLQKKKDKANSSKDLVYDAAQAASASQALSRKTENQQNSDANRSFDIIIENFDVAFGNKFLSSSHVLITWNFKFHTFLFFKGFTCWRRFDSRVWS